MTVNYTDPLQTAGLLPITSTFSSVTFSDTIYLLWVNQVIQAEDQFVITTDMNLVPTTDNLNVMLPTTTQQAVGAKFLLNNTTEFSINVYTVDNQLVAVLDPKSEDTPNAVYFQIIDQTSTQLDNWQTLVAGSNSNVFDVASILGNGLQAATLPSGDKLVLKKYNTDLIENILARNPDDITQFIIVNDATAFTTLDYTLMVTNTLESQCVVVLDASAPMALNYGFGINFINASNTPMVLVTKVGDRINGVQNQATTGGLYASFVVDIGESCQLLATQYNGWRAAITNSQFKNTVTSTTIDVSSAQIQTLGNDYYIDFSNSFDVGYSQLLIITGSLNQTLYPITSANGLYFVMPNNIATTYIIRSLMTGVTNFKLGLGVRTGTGVFLKTTGTTMYANTNGGVQYTYICYFSNGNQITDILPLRDPAI